MKTFAEFELSPKILQAIADLNFETPTPVQKHVIPLLQNEKRDVIALAQTGTGKTAAFGLPIMHMIDTSKKHTQALILSPTRELCMQICNDLKDFAKYIDHINITPIYGGASIGNQIRQLERGSQIIVGTPGRMIDIMNRGKINLSQLSWLVLDEADEMLNMGFKDDLDCILNQTPKTKNTLLFSATMPNEVGKIARNYMHNPVEIVVGTKNSGAENINHIYYLTQPNDMYAALKRIVDFHPDIYGLVFCNTKVESQAVADELMKDGYNSDVLHGDLSQMQRDAVIKRFRSRSLQLLIATDVAARGIDVDDLTHVINYHLPYETEQYNHRSGRTGRAGKSGTAISIITRNETNKISIIEKKIGKKLVAAKVPTGKEVCEKQLLESIKNIKAVPVDETEIKRLMTDLFDQFAELTKEDIIMKFVSSEFNRFLNYYKNLPDITLIAAKIEKRGGSKGDGNTSGSQRMFINLGRMDGFDRDSLVKHIIKTAKLQKSHVLSMDLQHSFSFFEVESIAAVDIHNAFAHQKFNSRSIRIDNADGGRNNRSKDFSHKRKR